jgi:hypothetical protein
VVCKVVAQQQGQNALADGAKTEHQQAALEFGPFDIAVIRRVKGHWHHAVYLFSVIRYSISPRPATGTKGSTTSVMYSLDIGDDLR